VEIGKALVCRSNSKPKQAYEFWANPKAQFNLQPHCQKTAKLISSLPVAVRRYNLSGGLWTHQQWWQRTDTAWSGRERTVMGLLYGIVIKPNANETKQKKARAALVNQPDSRHSYL